jgi:hypothetical protein
VNRPQVIVVRCARITPLNKNPPAAFKVRIKWAGLAGAGCCGTRRDDPSPGRGGPARPRRKGLAQLSQHPRHEDIANTRNRVKAKKQKEPEHRNMCIVSATSTRLPWKPLPARQHSRRLTRTTNGFSKNFERHVASMRPLVAYYNLYRVHSPHGKTPAMALWTAQDRSGSSKNLSWQQWNQKTCQRGCRLC